MYIFQKCTVPCFVVSICVWFCWDSLRTCPLPPDPTAAAMALVAQAAPSPEGPRSFRGRPQAPQWMVHMHILHKYIIRVPRPDN